MTTIEITRLIEEIAEMEAKLDKTLAEMIQAPNDVLASGLKEAAKHLLRYLHNLDKDLEGMFLDAVHAAVHVHGHSLEHCQCIQGFYSTHVVAAQMLRHLKVRVVSLISYGW
jgi:hypothetical protein